VLAKPRLVLCATITCLMAGACVTVVPGPPLEPVPYEPIGRTAFVFESGLSVEMLSGDVEDVLSGGGMDLDTGVGLEFAFGPRTGNTSVTFGYKFGATNAWFPAGYVPMDLDMATIKVERFVPIVRPEDQGVSREFALAFTAIPYAIFHDKIGEGWSDGMGVAVEAAFCHRIVNVYRPGSFEFARYALGFRTIAFKEIDITSFATGEVNDSLNSLYFKLAFDARF